MTGMRLPDESASTESHSSLNARLARASRWSIASAKSSAAWWEPALQVSESRLFKYFVHGVVLASIIQPGLSMSLQEQSWDLVWTISSNVFLAVFLLEMVVHVLAQGRSYFRSAAHLFDFVLVWMNVLEVWVLPLAMGDYVTARVFLLRMVRLLRLLRMFKLLRAQRQLQIVGAGIAASVSALFWIGLLLLAALYVGGVICCSLLADEEGLSANGLDPHVHFGTVFRSMLTLLNLVLLTEWETIIWAVYEQYGGAACLPFVLFVVICSFGIMNVIIAVIVDRTNEAGNSYRKGDLELRRQVQESLVSQLSQVMNCLDKDANDVLTYDEVLDAENLPEFRNVMKSMEFPAGFSTRDLYSMLDSKGDQKLSKKDFVQGMHRLVHGDDFQRLCVLQLSASQLKSDLRQTREVILHEMREHQSFLMQELAALRAHVSIPRPDVLREIHPAREFESYSRAADNPAVPVLAEAGRDEASTTETTGAAGGRICDPWEAELDVDLERAATGPEPSGFEPARGVPQCSVDGFLADPFLRLLPASLVPPNAQNPEIGGTSYVCAHALERKRLACHTAVLDAVDASTLRQDRLDMCKGAAHVKSERTGLASHTSVMDDVDSSTLSVDRLGPCEGAACFKPESRSVSPWHGSPLRL